MALMSRGFNLTASSLYRLMMLSDIPGNPTLNEMVNSINKALEFDCGYLWTLPVVPQRGGLLWLSLDTYAVDDSMLIVEEGPYPDRDIVLHWWAVILHSLGRTLQETSAI